MGRLLTTAYAPDLVAEARRDHGHGSLAAPRVTVRNANLSCGDEVELDLDHDGERIAGVAQRTRGCAFTRGSASLLAQLLPSLSLAEARELVAALRRDLAGPAPLPPGLAALAEVRMYPARRRCALLPWDALATAIDQV